LQQKFTHSHTYRDTHTHTRFSSSSFTVNLSLLRRTAYARVQFSGCSPTTNVNSETEQMAVCCQNLTLGALSSGSALCVLVGALFKKFGLVLNTPRTFKYTIYICIYILILGRSRWSHRRRRGSVDACMLGLRVRTPPVAWKSVCFECCVLLGSCLCGGLIIRPERSYRLWCISV
jgi:hypothetical protein